MIQGRVDRKKGGGGEGEMRRGAMGIERHAWGNGVG